MALLLGGLGYTIAYLPIVCIGWIYRKLRGERTLGVMGSLGIATVSLLIVSLFGAIGIGLKSLGVMSSVIGTHINAGMPDSLIEKSTTEMTNEMINLMLGWAMACPIYAAMIMAFLLARRTWRQYKNRKIKIASKERDYSMGKSARTVKRKVCIQQLPDAPTTKNVSDRISPN